MNGQRERRERRVYELAVVDSLAKPWPAAETLHALDVPAGVIARYKQVRRHFTAGLKRMARENRN